MKSIYRNLFPALFLAFTACNSMGDKAEVKQNSAENLTKINPYEFFQYPPQAYSNFHTGEIKPSGWIKTQMEKDLEGFIGHLEELAPQVLEEDDIYGADRRTNLNQGTDVSPNALAWWNSESQSNWWDGLIRSAILTENEAYLEEVKEYVDDKFRTQESDGYLGIYAEDLRYQEEGENADFWSQASLFRGLLAYYEYTEDLETLIRIKEAVERSMKAYPIGESTPFKKLEVGHSLIFTDVLDRLYQITGDESYLDYAVWLLKDYNLHRNIPENYLAPDILLTNVLNEDYKLKGHGVHTYELFRALITGYYATGNPVLKKAIEDYSVKIASVESPSGGPSGDEWIGERKADASEVGYEYCSIHELLDSYSFLLQKNGDLHLADKVEWLLFNAGQGARHPEGNAIAYCKTDNSYSMLGGLHEEGEELRYKYSPVHQDVAVCCAPNAGRIYPYYVQSMYLRKDDGVLATLYGPSILETEINGVKVRIRQITNYPFEHNIKFLIEPEKPVSFDLALRKPEWASAVKLENQIVSGPEIMDGILSLNREWNKGDTVEISFSAEIEIKEDKEGDSFFAYGPLAFAAPIEAKEKIFKEYGLDGFRDTFYAPLTRGSEPFTLPANSEGELVKNEYSPDNPWESLLIETNLFNPTSDEEERVTLQPMGGTLLRQLTFSEKE